MTEAIQTIAVQDGRLVFDGEIVPHVKAEQLDTELFRIQMQHGEQMVEATTAECRTWLPLLVEAFRYGVPGEGARPG